MVRTRSLCQAAITLTNHLFESMLKYALINLDGKENKQKEEEINGRVISSLIEKYEEGMNRYGEQDLGSNINSACTLGLITEEQKIQLHDFRVRFRNAYGQGIVQAMKAQSDAPQYFAYIDSLAREIREKLFGPIDQDPTQD